MTTDIVKQIRKATRRRFTAEEKIRIVLEGLRGEIPITDLCRKEGIQSSIYYKWSKAFLDSGKNGLTRETRRDATSGEFRHLKEENEALKRAVAERSWINSRFPAQPTIGGDTPFDREVWQDFETGPLDPDGSGIRSCPRRDRILETALLFPERSPREVSCQVTDTCGFTVSESSVYRILKAEGLIREVQLRGFPAESEYRIKTTRINQQWQTDATCWSRTGAGTI